MRNVSDEGSREIKNTHFMFNYFLFPKIMPSMIWKKKKILHSRKRHMLEN